ncbi:aminoacyl-tRNA hydrolase [Candidatus Giovannonibacteria bacterium RIFCSPLOWO2_01_FULL_44_40]|uniref:Peptidyl-tRNA hydrolase n=1 Tax=Candidatus Giovannonibacteria bacterium RIFCSPHIGHO2_01_FULL_45_23 TaxID=1798325 RepID=A0A1F5VFI5_9BACT|nr:MAG: aminoacyl-tRNA hydrolase [Candidatus Giovannonibacteria bacterium RIFCSPHIGHO2_01_FULL_45_23]OGF75146.1 MAG: aminoacyl-tRNA hydrolase [Candidatus Giovannonibacteria bacterium RIFCSPHIGHO2_02_FULL_45_13]OGF79710.1 MAG: aminoacyl-tRNA hydrolase [Candidatus Giovannonibacteria bacterium RIFCSPLOWO2_01_FULL_44_40]
MIRLILGLGNPGQEYENTRHNSGRMAAEYFAKKMGFSDFEYDKKSNSLISKSAQITVALPETFMNKSGQAAAKLIRPKKEMKELIVIHDDLDLLLGRFKISYGKSSGGHKGVESVMRALKTKNFVRIRVGVSPKHKPPQKEVIEFIVGKFKPSELEIFKKVLRKISDALETIITDGYDRAMSEFNH